MKRDFLLQLGVPEDLIDKIMDENGKDIEKNKNNAELYKTELEGLKEQLTTRDKDIADLKKSSKSSQDLQGQIKSLQEKYDKDTTDLQNVVHQTKFDSALDIALAGSGAKNPKALKGLLALDKITFEDEGLSGFSEQLEQIKSENEFLFNSDEPAPDIVKPTPGDPKNFGDEAIRAAMGLPNTQK